MQTRRAQQPRSNRSITDKETGMTKILVGVACLMLSLVGASSRAEAQLWPPPPTVPANIAGAQIVGITFGPENPYGVKITLDQYHPHCPEGFVLGQEPKQVNYKETFATLLAAFMGHKVIDIWFLEPYVRFNGAWNGSNGAFCHINLFQVRH